MRASRVVCLAVMAFGLGACATPIELPQSFVHLRDGGAGYRAITNDDARLWVRTFKDPTEAGVEFWAGTLERDLVEQRGYEKVGDSIVKNRAGDEGRLLELAANVRGERVDYMIAVWAEPVSFGSGTWITVVEFAASREVYQERIDSVRAALGTVQ